MARIHIYTDGSCNVHGEDKPGGWATVLVDTWTFRKDSGTFYEKQLSGHKTNTTVGEMEITAAIEGLKVLKGGPYNVIVFTDSQYLVGAMSGNKRKRHKALLAELDDLASQHQVTFQWVRGHEDTTYNLKVDKLAVAARKNA